jgi:hypothetical protein
MPLVVEYLPSKYKALHDIVTQYHEEKPPPKNYYN